MALVTRSFSMPVLRYGEPRAGEPVELHEVGLRVDAAAKVNLTSVGQATGALDAMQRLLGGWLQSNVYGRLLLAQGDDAARNYALAHPRELPRGSLPIAGPFAAQTIATMILGHAVPSLFVNQQIRPCHVQVTLDPGDAYAVASDADHGLTGGLPCTVNAPSPARGYTRASAKSPLPPQGPSISHCGAPS